MDELIGHNNPPSQIETIQEVASDLSSWMANHPVVSNEDEAREAKLLLDRSKLGLQDLESERDALVRPLNTQLREINNQYRGPRELLERVVDELKFRVTDFVAKEEAKRIAAAEEARLAAERAEQAARDAERIEKEQLDSAAQGELDVNVLMSIEEADRAFADYKKAERQAVIAERDSRVKIGGGFTRALSLKSREIIIVYDPIAAIKDIGLGNEEIIEAIIKAARAYKKIMNVYPSGIRIETERKV